MRHPKYETVIIRQRCDSSSITLVLGGNLQHVPELALA
jgi:hypothetical protein